MCIRDSNDIPEGIDIRDKYQRTQDYRNPSLEDEAFDPGPGNQGQQEDPDDQPEHAERSSTGPLGFKSGSKHRLIMEMAALAVLGHRRILVTGQAGQLVDLFIFYASDFARTLRKLPMVVTPDRRINLGNPWMLAS